MEVCVFLTQVWCCFCMFMWIFFVFIFIFDDVKDIFTLFLTHDWVKHEENQVWSYKWTYVELFHQWIGLYKTGSFMISAWSSQQVFLLWGVTSLGLVSGVLQLLWWDSVTQNLNETLTQSKVLLSLFQFPASL